MNQLLIGIIGAMGVSGYFYYTSTQTELYELRQLNSAYELKHQQQEEAINTLQNDFAVQSARLLDMQMESQEIQAEMNRYLDIFKRHNLTKLAAAKPGLIETKANKGTKNVFDSIEADSTSLDSLDDGVQLDTATTSGSQDNNETSGAKDSTTNTTSSN
jgi:hypothetical protein